MKKQLTEKQIKRLEQLNKKNNILLEKKQKALDILNPILEGLEKVRLEIDDIELG